MHTKLKIGVLVLGFFLGSFGFAGAVSIFSVQQGGTGAGSFTAGDCLKGNGTGAITTGACGSGTFPFTPTSNFGAAANSTSTPIWFRGSPYAFQASSTVLLGGDIIFPNDPAETEHDIQANTQTATNGNGSAIGIFSGAGNGSGHGGTMTLQSGNAGSGAAAGGNFSITSGNGGGTSGKGGNMTITAGAAVGSGQGGLVTIDAGNGAGASAGGDYFATAGFGGASGGNGGSVRFFSGRGLGGNADAGDVQFGAGDGNGSGRNGQFQFTPKNSAFNAVLDFDQLTAERLFHFPNEAGTTTLGTGSAGNCAQWSTTNTLTTTGSPCGSGGGSVGNWFTGFPSYNATSTVIGFLAGLFSTASSTFNSSLFLPNLSGGNLYLGSGGLVQSAASSSIFGYTPEQPLTFNSPLSRIGNAISFLFNTVNTWTGLNTFSATTTMATTTVGDINGTIYVDGTHYAQTEAGIVGALNACSALAPTCTTVDLLNTQTQIDSSGISVPGNIRITSSASSTLTTYASCASNAGIFINDGKGNIQIDHIHFNVAGSCVAFANRGGSNIIFESNEAYGTTTNVLAIYDGQRGTSATSTDFQIRDNNFHDAPNTSAAVYYLLRNGHDIVRPTVLNNVFNGTKGPAVKVDEQNDMYGLRESGNKFNNLLAGGHYYDVGVGFWGGLSFAYHIHDSQFTNNYYYSNLTPTFGGGINEIGVFLIYQSYNTIIDGNNMVGSWSQTNQVSGPAIAPGRVSNPDIGLTITNNTIEGFDAAWDPDAMENVEVANNVVRNSGTCFNVGYQIQLYVNIHDNTCYDSYSRNINNSIFQLNNSNPARKISVHDNTFTDDIASTTQLNMILLTGNVDFSDVTLRNNRFFIPNASTTLYHLQSGGEKLPIVMIGNEIEDMNAISENPNYANGNILFLGVTTTPAGTTTNTATLGDSNLFWDNVNKLLKIAGLLANASSTIGNGAQAGGLTINGGATTTGSAYIAGKLGINQQAPTQALDVSGNIHLTGPILLNTGQMVELAGDTNHGILYNSTLNGLESRGFAGFKWGIGSAGATVLANLVSGGFGLGTTSPFARFSIHANPTDNTLDRVLFAIASSTASATTTLFSIDNIGTITTNMTGTQCLHEVSGVVSGTGSDCGSGSGGTFSWTPTTNFNAAANSTSTPIWFTAGLQASSTSYFDTLVASSGSATFPSIQVGTGTIKKGLYDGGSAVLGLATNGATLQWDGAEFYPGANASKSLGIAGTNAFYHLFTTFASTTGEADFATNSYPQVIIGQKPTTPDFNVQVNSNFEGPYTSIGVSNDSNLGGAITAEGGIVADGNPSDSFNGISNYLALTNLKNTPLVLGFNNRNICGLYSDNTLDTLFDCYPPLNGKEMTYTASLPQNEGTVFMDHGLMNYDNTTGLQAFSNFYASTKYLQALPTVIMGWWEQENGNTSNARTSWDFFVASTSVNTTLGTSTVIALGDVSTSSYSTFGIGKNLNGSGATNNGVNLFGPTIQIVASTSRPQILGVFDGSNATTSQVFGIYSGQSDPNAGFASTTGLRLSNLTGTQCLHEIAGVVSGTGSDCGTGGSGVWPFTTSDTNYNVAVQSTSTPEWFKNGMMASSTSYFATIGLSSTTPFSGIGAGLVVNSNILSNNGIVSLANGTGIACSGNAGGSGSCSFANQSANTVLVNQSSAAGVPTGMATSTFGTNLYGNGTPGQVLQWGASSPAWATLFSYPFPLGATSTPLMLLASTTIGDGTTIGGLTVSGSATTTGNAYFASNVGIGIKAPLAPLHVDMTDGSTAIFSSVANAQSANAGIEFRYADGSATAHIAQIIGQLSTIPANNNAVLKFLLGAGSTAYKEVGRWSLNGFGIGTTTPVDTLTVASSTAPQLAFSDALGSNLWTERNINGNFYLATSTYSATSSIAAMTIDANGNVSHPLTLTIGTTSPISMLTIGAPFGTVPLNDSIFAISSSTQGATTTLFQILNTGHITASSTVPTFVASACGTSPSFTAGSGDFAGQITTGTAAPMSCAITFATAYSKAPSCQISGAPPSGKVGAALISSTTATGLSFMPSATTTVFTTGMTSWVINYQCVSLGTS